MPQAGDGEQTKLFEILAGSARVGGGDFGELTGQHPVDCGGGAGLAVQQQAGAVRKVMASGGRLDQKARIIDGDQI